MRKLIQKIIAQAIGPKKTLLSPPIKKDTSYDLIKLTKSKFNPIAKGSKPSIVVNAVNRTGRSLVLPASAIQNFISSIEMIFFFVF